MILFLSDLIQILFLAIRLYGKNWKKVTLHVGTRISAQVRSHAQKVLKGLLAQQQQPKLCGLGRQQG